MSSSQTELKKLEIVNVAKDLADRGEIMLADNKEDDELIY